MQLCPTYDYEHCATPQYPTTCPVLDWSYQLVCHRWKCIPIDPHPPVPPPDPEPEPVVDDGTLGIASTVGIIFGCLAVLILVSFNVITNKILKPFYNSKESFLVSFNVISNKILQLFYNFKESFIL